MPHQSNLLTLLQISDLHFSDQLGGNHVGPFDARLPILVQWSGIFDGLLGHHHKALSALDQFRRSLTDDTILLTVTGDLTANGASAQYGLADQFLSGRGRPRDPDLPHPDWQELSIPGNHDHWPGTNRIFGSPTAALAHYFPGPYPITLPPIPVWSGHRVRFILINSDEEVGPYSMSRLYARGSFVKQLASLANTLPPREEREIRVLIVHHSMMPSPPQGGAPTSGGVLEIETATRRVLEAFLVDSDISVVLCGHRHISRLSIITASNGVQQTQTLEARCGTTTQRDKYPYTVLQHLGNNRALPPNTLLLHRLVERDDGVYWTSQIYWLAKNAQFVDSLGHVSALLPRHLKAEIRVLPRP